MYKNQPSDVVYCGMSAESQNNEGKETAIAR
jgi:hypothetical protein